jgi:hypothetical protein
VTRRTLPCPLHISSGVMHETGLAPNYEIVFGTGLTDQQHGTLQRLLWGIEYVDQIVLGDRQHTTYGVLTEGMRTTYSLVLLAQLKKLLSPTMPYTASSTVLTGQTCWIVTKIHDELDAQEQARLLGTMRGHPAVEEMRTESWRDRLVIALRCSGKDAKNSSWVNDLHDELGIYATSPSPVLGVYAVTAFHVR